MQNHRFLSIASLIFLVQFLFLSLNSCSNDDTSDSDVIVGAWIEDGREPNGNEVFHIIFYNKGTFEEYVTFSGKRDYTTFTGIWTYNSPNLEIIFSDGETFSTTVKDNRFTIGEITFKKL